MKNVLTISFAAVLLAACAPDAREADEEAIRQADIAWSKTGETKDLQAQMEFYTDDPTPIMMPPDAPMTVGKEAILEGLSALYDVPGFSVKWRPAEVEVARSGDIGFVRGAWEMTLIDADGNPAHDKGKYIEIWKKQANGTWKVAVDIFNSDLPSALGERGVPEPREVIDLGALVTEDLPERVWGNGFMRAMNLDRPNSFDVIHWDFADGLVSGSNAYYTLANHGGPHVDAPNHVGLEGGIDSYAVEVFSGPLKVIDVSTYPLGRTVPADVFQGQDIQPGDIVLIYTAYTPPQNDADFPETIALTAAAAVYLAQIPVRAFGTDAFAVANLQAEPAEGDTALARVLPNHNAFLSRNIPIYEQLFNVERLLGKENMYFTGAPLNIKEGDGMMVRPLVFLY